MISGINSAAVNILASVFWWMYDHFSVGCALCEVAFLGHIDYAYLELL